MSLIRVYTRVLGLLGPEKGLAAALLLANVALACSQFAEPLLFGKVIDKLSHAQGASAFPQWTEIGPWLTAWAAFGLFIIVAGVMVALHADRLAHRRRVVVMSAYFEHALHLPMRFHAGVHTGRLLKVMIEGAAGMFGVWLSFFREHFAALVALVVLLPATLFVNWRLGAILVALVIILGFLMNTVLTRTETMQSQGTLSATIWRSGCRTFWATCRRSGASRAPMRKRARCPNLSIACSTPRCRC